MRSVQGECRKETNGKGRIAQLFQSWIDRDLQQLDSDRMSFITLMDVFGEDYDYCAQPIPVEIREPLSQFQEFSPQQQSQIYSEEKNDSLALLPTAPIFTEIYIDLTPQRSPIDSGNPSRASQDMVLPKKTRSFSIIAVRSEIQAKLKRGGRFETNNIGKHLKSLVNKLLSAMEDIKVLSMSDLKSVRQFRESNGSRRDFRQLLRSESIRKRFVEFTSSHSFVRDILVSAKMSFHSKQVMLKHLEKLRTVAHNQSTTWKD